MGIMKDLEVLSTGTHLFAVVKVSRNGPVRRTGKRTKVIKFNLSHYVLLS